MSSASSKDHRFVLADRLRCISQRLSIAPSSFQIRSGRAYGVSLGLLVRESIVDTAYYYDNQLLVTSTLSNIPSLDQGPQQRRRRSDYICPSPWGPSIADTADLMASFDVFSLSTLVSRNGLIAASVLFVASALLRCLCSTATENNCLVARRSASSLLLRLSLYSSISVFTGAGASSGTLPALPKVPRRP
ncbi:hypothetical protein BKA93DRAFT_365739 [Sparassis latifolia]